MFIVVFVMAMHQNTTKMRHRKQCGKRHKIVVELMTAADDTGMTPLHVGAARYFALVHSFKACVMVPWVASIHSKSLCWVPSIQRMSAPAS